VGYATRGKKNLKFIPHPKPGKDNDKNKNKIGKDALPIPSLREWLKERQKHGRR